MSRKVKIFLSVVILLFSSFYMYKTWQRYHPTKRRYIPPVKVSSSKEGQKRYSERRQKRYSGRNLLKSYEKRLKLTLHQKKKVINIMRNRNMPFPKRIEEVRKILNPEQQKEFDKIIRDFRSRVRERIKKRMQKISKLLTPEEQKIFFRKMKTRRPRMWNFINNVMQNEKNK